MLNEINFGDFEGLSFKKIEKDYPKEFEKMIKEGFEYKYPNGESLTDTFHRVNRDTPIISMSMGSLGAISRMTGELFGSAVTFASLSKSSAPGQLTLTRAIDELTFMHQVLN